MKLYLVHVGFYDPKLMDGLYEQHCNFFVVANNIKDAKQNIKNKSIFKKNKMHIDGIQEVNIVDGFKIKLIKDTVKSDLENYNYDEIKNIKI